MNRAEKRVVRALPDWDSVQVKSCADGSMNVQPKWCGFKPYKDGDGGGPGLFTRLSAANKLQRYLNAALAARQAKGKEGKRGKA